MSRYRDPKHIIRAAPGGIHPDLSAVLFGFPPWLDGGALCAQGDPDMFFPEAGGRSDVSGAKSICRRCPLLEDCREYALRTRPSFGIFGGMTPRERQAENRRRKALKRKAS